MPSPNLSVGPAFVTPYSPMVCWPRLHGKNLFEWRAYRQVIRYTVWYNIWEYAFLFYPSCWDAENWKLKISFRLIFLNRNPVNFSFVHFSWKQKDWIYADLLLVSRPSILSPVVNPGSIESLGILKGCQYKYLYYKPQDTYHT